MIAVSLRAGTSRDRATMMRFLSATVPIHPRGTAGSKALHGFRNAAISRRLRAPCVLRQTPIDTFAGSVRAAIMHMSSHTARLRGAASMQIAVAGLFQLRSVGDTNSSGQPSAALFARSLTRCC